MVRIEVRNFQSIEKATMDLDGFSVLVGRSNLGKTAFVRAVKAALTGAAGTAYIRHGKACERVLKKRNTCKCSCSVHIKTENFDLKWEKGDAINRYTFNNEVYDKAERGTPEFLHPFCAPINVGSDKVLVQVADQFSPIFLLDETGATVADVLSDVAHLDRINLAMRAADKDRKAHIATRRVREDDAVKLKAKLVAFDTLDSTLASLRALDVAYREVCKAEESFQLLLGFLQSARMMKDALSQLQATQEVNVPDGASVRSGYNDWCCLADWAREHEQKVRTIETLEPLGEISVPDPDLMAKASKAASLLLGWLTRLRACKAVLETGSVLEGLAEPSSEALDLAAGRAIRLGTLVVRWESLCDRVAELEAAVAQADKTLQEIEVEKQSLGVEECPTCSTLILAKSVQCHA